MMYKAVALDVDGVLTKVDSVWRYLHKSLGTWKKAERNKALYFSGKITYEKWALLDVQLWKGLEYNKLVSILKRAPIREGAWELIDFLKSKNIKIIAISAGLMTLVDILDEKFNFDLKYSNELVVVNGRLTGDVIVNVTYDNKGEVLRRACRKLKINVKKCIAIGDSEVDVPMLLESGFGIAYNPKSFKAAEVADMIIFSDNLKTLKNILSIIFC